MQIIINIYEVGRPTSYGLGQYSQLSFHSQWLSLGVFVVLSCNAKGILEISFGISNQMQCRLYS